MFFKWVYWFSKLGNNIFVVWSRFHAAITQLPRSNVEQEKDFIKIDDFQIFPVLVVLWLKINDFVLDFQKISLSGTAEAI